jgi:DNA topoisomerase I
MPDARDSARLAGLRYVHVDTTPGLRRLGAPKRFRYVDAAGRPVRDAAVLARIRALAIPPAWTDVWISPSANTHVQATGRDARRRKQYRYHAEWRRTREEVKFGRLLAFARALPRIRRRVRADLRRPGLPKDKVLATVLQLLERTLIRIGNDEYARQNGSIGLTTMNDRHARIGQSSVRFEFRGKSGIRHAVDVRDRHLAAVVKACRDLPGYELFQYVDEEGRRQAIDSADVNAYLRAIAGQEYSAKDFRTWAGTVLAALALAESERQRSKAAARSIVAAVETVAGRPR